MKPRHAAALALVGWYLMVPPLTSGGGPHDILFHAPLSKWEVGQEQDSKVECQNDLKENIEDLEDLKHVDDCASGSCVIITHQFASGRCIASDDPRLGNNPDVKKTQRAESN
jgi:hypothetical protein